MGFDAELAASVRIDLKHGRTGGAQVADHTVLFQLAGLEQTQQTAGMA